jgi:hypothetical protein
MVSPSVAEVGRLNVLHTVRKATGLERKTDLRSEGEDGASCAACSLGGGTGATLASRGGGGSTARSMFSC